MKNRFCRLGKTLLGAACLLSTCGLTYSCSDDFDLDETKPNFLGQSIYDELRHRTDRKFTYVIRLIDDLGYREVMSKTGSKTLFVADDDAYKKFFETTNWKDAQGNSVREYSQLSTSQKRLLLNGSQLNNAYVLEMLTTIQGPTKNLCLRQLSALTATDSVPYFPSAQLFHNQNVGQLLENGKRENVDRKFWATYTNRPEGMYLALDKSTPMMTHFLQAQMNEKNITPQDVSFILSLQGDDEWNDSRNRSFIYDAEVEEADVTCLNGYYHVLNKVLVTPENMAEMIRQNPNTSLFSDMLERFSLPFYDATLTEEYKALHTITADSVFQKLYIASNGPKGALTVDQNGETLAGYVTPLPFDPGWNAYSANNSTKEQDMAAMFVPDDHAMAQYFLVGGGKDMLERYEPEILKKGYTADNYNKEELRTSIFQIPIGVIQPLVANLMKESFNATVPSKYLTIMNSAQDNMFPQSEYPKVDDYKKSISEVMLANNGVVYVLDNVVAPPDYAAVIGPVIFDKNSQVMRAIIQADDANVNTNFGAAPLRKFYSTYLKAMQAKFTLFVPTDEGLKNKGYIDPTSFTSGTAAQRRYYTLTPDSVTSNGQKQIPVRATAYNYMMNRDMDPSSDRASGTSWNSGANDNVDNADKGKIKKQIVTDMVDQHIIVHDSEKGETDISGNKRFYTSRSGAPVYISKKPSKVSLGDGLEVEGGMQVALNKDQYADNDFTCKWVKGYDKSQGYGNGHTYFIDRPMQPTVYNVWEIMSANPEFSMFFDLIKTLDGSTPLLETLFRDKSFDGQQSKWDREKQKYAIVSADRISARNTKLIRYFNSYRYSMFIPTNEAMQKAFDNGLKTMDEIEAFVEEKTEAGEFDDEAKKQAKAMVTCLINFIKYHSCDETFYVDDVQDETDSQTAAMENGNFIKLTVNQNPGAIKLNDASGRIIEVAGGESFQNLLARDYEVDAEGTSARLIRNSSYVVLHGINDYLLFDAKLKGGFDKAWENEAEAESFCKKFRLMN